MKRDNMTEKKIYNKIAMCNERLSVILWILCCWSKQERFTDDDCTMTTNKKFNAYFLLAEKCPAPNPKWTIFKKFLFSSFVILIFFFLRYFILAYYIFGVLLEHLFTKVYTKKSNCLMDEI